MLRRALGVVVALVVTIGLVAEASPAAAAPDAQRVEAEFVWRINYLRAEKGLGPLSVDQGLTAVARDWAGRMAAAGAISHRPDLAAVAPDPTWVKLGENVGVGADSQSLHDAFVASPAHYANLVDGAWQTVGVGVVVVGDTVYVAENFMRSTAAAPAAQAPAKASTKASAKKSSHKRVATKKATPTRKNVRRR